MIDRNRLYDAFGELIYAIAVADGIVQGEEVRALEACLENHPRAKEIKWSFDYEKSRKTTMEYAYHKAIDTCKENGPDAEYLFFIEVLESVAHSNEMEPEQLEMIDRFETELKSKFLDDYIKENN
ncbi:TerB family tellurite resistance protein [Aureibacter tunicatorum]|uniref:Tellurite resistance protein TerB n=1 Tax=Aureibacter tunicatorum TaxID=866807 RepID=A0AAE4BQD9_9BACT|nr:TerB family tellurite resistance protein [Aureibacter tunicatorum]MDR6239004.1 hypothetical protein [Aureibacter tunicatorum]BDD05070.1 hypothetical protein AUTU_25530 [Aureibacter tunicatorum]